MIDINELRRLAQAATPGPWIAAGPSFGESLPKHLNEVVVDREGDEDDGYSICNAPIGLNEERSDDMEFIAEANPLAIEELLDRLETAEKERDALRAALQHEADCMEAAKAEIDALRAKVAEMEQQEPVAWLHESRRDSDVVTSAVKHVWQRARPMSLASYSIPLYLAPGAK